MPRKAKLVLPTVDTCRWREVGPASTECGLVASVLGIRSNDLSAVSDDQCAACCRSFPSSPQQLNPVVASLLYASASRVLDAGGIAQCSSDKAAEIKQFAERSLNLDHPQRFKVTPARTNSSCCWLGEPFPQTTFGKVDQQPGCEQLGSNDEPIHECRHPDHQQTTPSHCRMCRDWSKSRPVSRFLSLEELVPPPDRRFGSPVTRWAVGVATAPRRRPTLETCLDSIVRAGWEEPHLFLDGTTQLPERYCRLPVTWREDSIGAWPAWYFALAELVLQKRDADAFVLLQDDVVLYDRESLRQYLERVLWPSEGPTIISLFYTGVDAAAGWFRAHGGWHWGAQGFIFHPGVARSLLADADLSRAWLAAASNTHIPIPEVLYEWVNRTGMNVWYANPSLLQHIGNTSTIWMNAGIAGGRRAPWFSGSIETPFAAEGSLADFPEDAFVCTENVRDDYERRVQRGRDRMSKHSVVLCGLCRDVRRFLPRTAARMERLGEMFRDYRVVLMENDSIDATREFLADWNAANPRVNVLSESFKAPRYPQVRSLDRAAWMARCRNRYREHVVKTYSDYDYVIVIDTDLPGGWSFNGVAHTFGEEEWDFVGSYGLEQRLNHPPNDFPFWHYDVWAFRPARGTPARKLVDHTQLHLRRGDPLLPVESCFGGLGVYRTACMLSCEYGGETDIEHVVFHERLRDAGFSRLFLNPSQIVLYSPMT